MQQGFTALRGLYQGFGVWGRKFYTRNPRPYEGFLRVFGQAGAEGLEERGFRACWAEALND